MILRSINLYVDDLADNSTCIGKIPHIHTLKKHFKKPISFKVVESTELINNVRPAKKTKQLETYTYNNQEKNYRTYGLRINGRGLLYIAPDPIEFVISFASTGHPAAHSR